MAFKTKIIGNPHENDVGYDEVLNLKQEERVVWYEGKSDKIFQNLKNSTTANYEEFKYHYGQ